MGNRLTPAQWSLIKKDFPDIAKAATEIKLDFESRLFKSSYRRFKKKKKKVTAPNLNSSIVNDTLLEILEWCDDMSSGDFYVTKSNITDDGSIMFGPSRSVIFYFAEDSDAIMFKLTWMNSKGIEDE